ncbi:slit homolog 2 protein-like [Ostrea edulis]|uniref:slit homolog 2 protein-like n=1 Tax=Ostrea edulis TaxID=37623 RepID=UPI0024AF991B|nr:slit homolog 2 protein-like [Ostrea edulis]
MQLVVWLSVMLSVLYSQETNACPDQCSCSKSSSCNGTDVNCEGKGLSRVPTNIPTDTCILNLKRNQITILPDGILDTLINLQYINLRWNLITTLPEAIFDRLVNLLALSLRDNRITTLPRGIFDNLVNLTTLYLSNNQITTLQKQGFGRLMKLQTIAVDGNPLNCDCRLVAFLGFAESRTLTLKISKEPSCQSPLNLKGTLLKDKVLQEMVCDSGKLFILVLQILVLNKHAFLLI